jgi:hypothetical protein
MEDAASGVNRRDGYPRAALLRVKIRGAWTNLALPPPVPLPYGDPYPLPSTRFLWTLLYLVPAAWCFAAFSVLYAWAFFWLPVLPRFAGAWLVHYALIFLSAFLYLLSVEVQCMREDGLGCSHCMGQTPLI